MFVIDASALLDAALRDRPEWAVAVDDARRRGLHGPSILASEVAHVVHKKRPQEFGATVALRSAALELLLAQPVLAVSDAAHREAAAMIASTGLSFYDAEYAAVADRFGFALVTHDEDMARVARQVLGKPRVLDLDGLRQQVKRPAAS